MVYENFTDVIVLSIYDGGYKASLYYNDVVYDLTNIDKETCIYEDYKFIGMNDLAINLSNLYENYIKDNNWYTFKQVAINFLFNEFDVGILVICEDGKIEIIDR